MLLFVAGERVEQIELVRGTSESALLELAGHRDQTLAGQREVFPRRAAPPGVGASSAVGKDSACKHEPFLVIGPQLRENGQLLVVEEPRRRVELGFDVGLRPVRTDICGIAFGTQQEPDRLREDRLARAGLAGDRIQARSEGQLRLADQDEVLDAKAPKHGLDATSAGRAGRPAETDDAARSLFVHARPWVGGGLGRYRARRARVCARSVSKA